MIEIRIHGRGGQGAVTAAKLLAKAFFVDGKYSQSFPSFTAARRGAPAIAFTRVNNSFIRLRCNVYTPDCLLVLDPSLFSMSNIAAGLKKDGYIIINSDRPPDFFSFLKDYKVATVDADAVAARHHLGTASSPIVNTTILGAFSKVTDMPNIESIIRAVKESVPFNKLENIKAVEEAYTKVIYNNG